MIMIKIEHIFTMIARCLSEDRSFSVLVMMLFRIPCMSAFFGPDIIFGKKERCISSGLERVNESLQFLTYSVDYSLNFKVMCKKTQKLNSNKPDLTAVPLCLKTQNYVLTFSKQLFKLRRRQ